MMKMAITACAAVLVAGCGSEKSGTFETEDGETGTYTVDQSGEAVTATVETSEGTARMQSGSDVPLDLPRGFSIYPGAKVVTNTVFDQPGSKGALVTMAASASPEDMIAHYRRQAEAAGVDLELDMTTDTMRMIGGKAPDGSAFSFTATAGADGTTGQLLVGQASQ